jgi:hypothetical protein
MKVGFSDGFFKSFKRMINRQRWYWKIWDFFRCDIPRFLRNVWLFRKNLWNHTWYNGDTSILPWIKTAVDDMCWRIEKNGHEVEESRMKKIAKMKRLSYLIDVHINDSFIDIAESELDLKMILHDSEFEPVEGKTDSYQLKDKDTPEEKEINSKILERSYQIQKEYWEELCRIIKGPDYDKIQESDEDFDKLYDGSDIRAWWD